MGWSIPRAGRFVAAGVLALVFAACGNDGPVDPPPASSAPPDLTMVPISGDGQLGKVGEELPEPLEVRVTDAGGEPLSGIEVVWSVDPDLGRLDTVTSDGFVVAGSAIYDSTGSEGMSRATFRPSALGTLSVTARVPGARGSSVVFTTDVELVVIHFFAGLFDGFYFWTSLTGWDFEENFVVPVGTPIEWRVSSSLSGETMARIRSIDAPGDGSAFDSGELGVGERFQFVPSVAGSWDFVEEESGTQGTLTAR